MADVSEVLETLGACDEALTGTAWRRGRDPQDHRGPRAADGGGPGVHRRREATPRGRRATPAPSSKGAPDLRGAAEQVPGRSTAQVKTNQEYTALLHEIDGATGRRIAQLEDEHPRSRWSSWPRHSRPRSVGTMVKRSTAASSREDRVSQIAELSAARSDRGGAGNRRARVGGRGARSRAWTRARPAAIYRAHYRKCLQGALERHGAHSRSALVQRVLPRRAVRDHRESHPRRRGPSLRQLQPRYSLP